MAQLRKENDELSLIVNESVELAEMYKAELLTLQEKQNTGFKDIKRLLQDLNHWFRRDTSLDICTHSLSVSTAR